MDLLTADDLRQMVAEKRYMLVVPGSNYGEFETTEPITRTQIRFTPDMVKRCVQHSMRLLARAAMFDGSEWNELAIGIITWHDGQLYVVQFAGGPAQREFWYAWMNRY